MNLPSAANWISVHSLLCLRKHLVMPLLNSFLIPNSDDLYIRALECL